MPRLTKRFVETADIKEKPYFLFDELIDSLGRKGVGRAFLAHRNGLELFPRVDILTNGHGNCGGSCGVHIQPITL